MPWYLWVGFDLAFLILLIGAVGLPLAGVGALILASGLPSWLVLLLIPAWAVLFLFLSAAFVGVMCRILPRLEPGRYPYPGHPQSVTWLARFALQRIMNLPVWSPLIFGFATVRYAVLRASGARVAFDMQTSSDARLTDPSLTEVGPGCMLAAGTFIACHLIESGELLLAPVRLAEGVQLMGEVTLAPGVTIGAHCVIGPGSKILPHVTLGEDTFVGLGCILYQDCRIGANAVIGHHVTLEQGAVVGEGAVIQAGSRVPKGTVIHDGDIFPPRTGGPR